MGTVAVDLALEEAPNEEQRPEKEVATGTAVQSPLTGRQSREVGGGRLPRDLLAHVSCDTPPHDKLTGTTLCPLEGIGGAEGAVSGRGSY